MFPAVRDRFARSFLGVLLVGAFVAQPLVPGAVLPLPPAALAQTVPIPSLPQWQANMTTYGQQDCATLANEAVNYYQSHTAGSENDDVYYDAERVFYQIARYTGDPSWILCAHIAQGIYRDQYVIPNLQNGPNNSGVPGYIVFTTGLRMDYDQTGDPLSQEAVFLLSLNAAFASDNTPLDSTVSADLSREVAYAIVSYINAQALGQAPRQRRIDLVNQAYGHLDQWFMKFSWPAPSPVPATPGPWPSPSTTSTTSRLAPFMVGLTAQSLIRDWEQTQDARLIPALERAADWLWANAWIPSAQAFWYEFPDSTQACCVASGAAPDLNLLIAPIYAFLYWQTGLTKYRDEGDQIFAGGVQNAWLGDGKHFDQNYTWSFDYVKWRGLAPVPTAPPAVSITAPAAGASVSGIATVSASATDAAGIASVQFQVDGANIGSALTTAPYAVSWDTTTAPDATHTLTAVASDVVGNVATSAPVAVTVANGTGGTGIGGLVGYWKFDEGAGTAAADASGNGNTGTLIGGPVWTAGQIGEALAFNGTSSYVTVPSQTGLNAYPLTIAVWMKTNSTSGVVGLVNKYVAYSQNGWNLFLNNGNLCAWYYADAADMVYPGGGCPFNLPGYNDNTWHQVVFAVDDTGGALYVDGASKGSIPWTGTPGAPTTAQPVNIAYYPHGGAKRPGGPGVGMYFSGVLDDVRIYNRALSAAEVQQLYTLESGGVAP